MWTDLIQSRFGGVEQKKFARLAIKENIFIIFLCVFFHESRLCGIFFVENSFNDRIFDYYENLQGMVSEIF